MARLNRGRVRYGRYQSCSQMTLLASIGVVAGEEDLCMLWCVCCLYEWRRYHELLAPTTLEGVFPNLNFFEAIGGFDFKEVFRFEKPHFLQLLRRLELPDSSEVSRGGYGVTRVPADVALALTLLWRLSAPTTLVRDRSFLGMSETLICEVFNLTIEAIYERWGHLVEHLQVDAILPKIDTFCEAIHAKGAPLPRCCFFLDGTIRKIARPVRWQRIYYNGWKCVHALKYQAVDSPDGIIRQLWGPTVGRRHDVTLLGQSALLSYKVAGILTNCQCCFCPNQTSTFFGVPPPPLRAYLVEEG
ncbi:unnamed protein product [Ectocarpus sp. CCAP 1310/34]|nr:unnamed protein product [Ectocarpus sp. CCAP 1310/34]